MIVGALAVGFIVGQLAVIWLLFRFVKAFDLYREMFIVAHRQLNANQVQNVVIHERQERILDHLKRLQTPKEAA